MTKFQPMLSGKGDLENVKFPVYASPKLDGIRCIIRDGVALSRKLKPIPNAFVQAQLAGLPDGLDGELIVGSPTAPDVRIKTSSGVMSRDGEPDFRFHVFDRVSPLPFATRLQSAVQATRSFVGLCEIVPHTYFTTIDELVRFEQHTVYLGYEGIMLRDPGGPYKFGRSTAKEGYLLKIKRWHDIEAVVVDVVERMHNENAQEVDERGYAKRSKAKAGMVGTGTMGTLVCEATINGKDERFEIGTGFDEAQRVALWKDKPIGRVLTFKFQQITPDNKPFLPVFLNFRED